MCMSEYRSYVSNHKVTVTLTILKFNSDNSGQCVIIIQQSIICLTKGIIEKDIEYLYTKEK